MLTFRHVIARTRQTSSSSSLRSIPQYSSSSYSCSILSSARQSSIRLSTKRYAGSQTKKEITKTTTDTTATSSSSSPSSPSSVNQVLTPTNEFMAKQRIAGWSDSSLAILAGHSAFLFMGMAYVTKDILYLRLLAMGSIGLTSLFQYYRPQPLVIPLRWNVLFLSINAIMAALVYQERRLADNMTDEQNTLFYDGQFEERGFSKVEFYRLFQLATRVELDEGFHMKTMGQPNNTLYLIMTGSATVSRDDITLSHLEEADFIGEMDFIRFLTMKDKEENDSPSLTDVVVNKGGAIVWTWNYNELETFVGTHRGVANALLAYIGHEVTEKLTDAWTLRMDEQQEKKELLGSDEKKILENVLNAPFAPDK